MAENPFLIPLQPKDSPASGTSANPFQKHVEGPTASANPFDSTLALMAERDGTATPEQQAQPSGPFDPAIIGQIDRMIERQTELGQRGFHKIERQTELGQRGF